MKFVLAVALACAFSSARADGPVPLTAPQLDSVYAALTVVRSLPPGTIVTVRPVSNTEVRLRQLRLQSPPARVCGRGC